MRTSGVMPAPRGFRLGHQHGRRSAVVEARRVGGRHRAVLVECRAQLLHRIERGAGANIFVAVDDGVALAALDGDGDDLVLELARLLRGFGLVLRGDREFVLGVTRDLELAGDILGRVAHVVAVEGVPQPVLDHRVDELQVAHLGAGAQMLAVRGQRHRFLAAGHDDRSVAAPDLLHAERDGAQAGTADLVEPPGGRFLGQAGADRRLASRVLALAGGQHLAEDDLVDFRAVDPGPSQYVLDHHDAELVRRRVGERAVEGTDRCAGRGGHDDCVGSGHVGLQK